MSHPGRIVGLLGTLLLASATQEGCPSGCPNRVVYNTDPWPSHGGAMYGVRQHHLWPRRHLTYALRDFPDNLTSQFEQVYAEAFALWSEVFAHCSTEERFTFSQVSSQADIEICWKEAEQWRELYNRIENAQVSADVLKKQDSYETMAEAPRMGGQPIAQYLKAQSARDWPPHVALRIAAHEIGHNLGIVDHVEDPDAIMAEWFADDGTPKDISLAPADINAIRELYGECPGQAADQLTFPVIPSPPTDCQSDLPESEDPDRDGLSTFAELQLTWPSGITLDPSKCDTDGDGLPDGFEVRYLLDPTRKDSDMDGIRDDEEIAGGMDPRDFVIVVGPGMVAVRLGVGRCTLPTVDQSPLGLALKDSDFRLAGFSPEDTVSVTAAATGTIVEGVSIQGWGEEGTCGVWLTQDLQTALGLEAGQHSEITIRRTDVPATMTIVYPPDGGLVPREHDYVASIHGAISGRTYVQFFVLAPDPWRYYPQNGAWIDGPGQVETRVYLGDVSYHDGLTYKVWAELRSEPAAIVEGGLPGLPPGDFLPGACPSPCLQRSPIITLTRDTLDADGDCISDADEMRNGTNPYDANEPYDTPPDIPLDDFDRFSDVWWYTDPEITPQPIVREDGLNWLQVDWDLEHSASEYAYISRRLEPTERMAYCQKLKADVQALGSVRLKGELKVSKEGGGFDWVRTETFMLEAGMRETIVVDLPRRWGEQLEREGIIDLLEVSFTVDRRYDNPLTGTYWIRNIRITGRPCLSEGTCPVE